MEILLWKSMKFTNNKKEKSDFWVWTFFLFFGKKDIACFGKIEEKIPIIFMEKSVCFFCGDFRGDGIETNCKRMFFILRWISIREKNVLTFIFLLEVIETGVWGFLS